MASAAARRPAKASAASTLLIPDAGPLFSLAACDCLGLLLNFDCAITDVVWRETAGRAAAQSASMEARAIAEFLLRHPQIQVRETQLGALTAGSPAGTSKVRNLGELSIHSLLIDLRSASPNVNSVVLFEDHWFSHRLTHFSAGVTLIGTASFLIAMEALGYLPSADDAINAIRQRRPTFAGPDAG